MRTPVATALALLLTAVLALPARLAAQEQPAPAPAAVPERVVEVLDPDTEPLSLWLGERWFGVFRGDARVGWLHRVLETVDHAGEPAVRRSIEMFVDIAGDGNAQHTSESAVYRLAEPQVLLAIERRVESQGRVGARRVVRNGGRFDVENLRDGETTKGAVRALDVTLSDELVTERTVTAAAVDEGDPAGTTGAGVGLDLLRMRAVKRIVRIVGAEKEEDGESLYEVAVATGPDSWSDPVVVDARGGLIRGALGGGLTIRRMSREEAQADLGRSSLEVAERIPMSGRLGDVLTIRELEISMPAPPEDAAAPFPATGRQICDTFDGRLHLRIHVDRDAGQATEAESDAALLPSQGVDSDDPALAAAATRILTGTSRPAVRVARLLEFTAQHLTYAVVVDEPNASELLRARHGDCTEHTRLFVALARASGIPAREVTGLIWLDDEQQSFGWHAWAEVELGGRWRPVDPTGGRNPAHAAHIRVDPAARAAGVLAGARFRLHDVVR